MNGRVRSTGRGKKTAGNRFADRGYELSLVDLGGAGGVCLVPRRGAGARRPYSNLTGSEGLRIEFPVVVELELGVRQRGVVTP